MQLDTTHTRAIFPHPFSGPHDGEEPTPLMKLKPDTTASTWEAERQLSAPPKETFFSEFSLSSPHLSFYDFHLSLLLRLPLFNFRFSEL